VPLGILAATLSGEWMIVAELVFRLALTYCARWLGFLLAVKVDRAEEEKRNRIIEVDSVSDFMC